jgi:peptide/nickel transport system permease protein
LPWRAPPCWCWWHLLAPWLAPYDPDCVTNVAERHACRLPPRIGSAQTSSGRDILSAACIYGAQLDLAIAVGRGQPVLCAGRRDRRVLRLSGGKLDRAVGRFVDVLMAFPLFVLAMAMVAALGNQVAEHRHTPRRSSTCPSTYASPARK